MAAARAGGGDRSVLVSLPSMFTPPLTLVLDSAFLSIFVWIAVRFRRAPSRFAVGVAVTWSVVHILLSGGALLGTIGLDPAWQVLCRAAATLLPVAVIVGALRVPQEEARPTERGLLTGARVATVVAMLTLSFPIIASSQQPADALWSLILLIFYGPVLLGLRKGVSKLSLGWAVALGCFGSLLGLGGLMETWGREGRDLEQAFSVLQLGSHVALLRAAVRAWPWQPLAARHGLVSSARPGMAPSALPEAAGWLGPCVPRVGCLCC